MAWKAHFVISDEPFTVTEEEEGKVSDDARRSECGEDKGDLES